MTTPIRIRCRSISEVPGDEKIRNMADSEHHVVLEFPTGLHVNKPPIIGRLSVAMPDHSVFDSGGNKETDWITVKPVLASLTVFKHSEEILAAITMYIEACSTLLGAYRTNSLSSEWSSDFHGGHCCLENAVTGQVIEVPMDGAPQPHEVDPYFFSKFVKSTPSCAAVAGLIKHDFHDAARILKLLARKNI
jgi:hypothetical protein